MRLSLFVFCIFLSIPFAVSAEEPAQAAPQTADSEWKVGPWTVPVQKSGIQKLLPDISAIGTFAGAYFSREPEDETGHDPARNGFTLQEVEVALQSVVDSYFKADIFIAFHEEEVELEEAFVTTLGGLPKGLQIKAGKFLLPFGRQNQKHLEQWSFADNTRVNQLLLGPENLNELGMEVSYLFPLPFFLEAKATLSNGENETSFGGSRGKDLLYQGRVAASADFGDAWTALAGGSVAFGFNNTGLGNQTNLYGGDLLLKWKPKAHRSVTWQTEYIQRVFEDNDQTARDGGLYSYIDWQFLKRWNAGVRFDRMGIPEGLIEGESRLTPGLTFHPTEFSRLRAQYEYIKTDGIAEAEHAGMLQLQFNIGPHGAHAF